MQEVDDKTEEEKKDEAFLEIIKKTPDLVSAIQEYSSTDITSL
jgi:hypothetical protein